MMDFLIFDIYKRKATFKSCNNSIVRKGHTAYHFTNRKTVENVSGRCKVMYMTFYDIQPPYSPQFFIPYGSFAQHATMIYYSLNPVYNHRSEKKKLGGD